MTTGWDCGAQVILPESTQKWASALPGADGAPAHVLVCRMQKGTHETHVASVVDQYAEGPGCSSGVRHFWIEWTSGNGETTLVERAACLAVETDGDDFGVCPLADGHPGEHDFE